MHTDAGNWPQVKTFPFPVVIMNLIISHLLQSTIDLVDLVDFCWYSSRCHISTICRTGLHGVIIGIDHASDNSITMAVKKWPGIVCNWKKEKFSQHNDVIKWKYFPCYWSFVRGIHRSPVNSPHKGQWRGPLMFSLICTWIHRWVNNRDAGNLRHHCAHYDVIVIKLQQLIRGEASNTIWATNILMV